MDRNKLRGYMASAGLSQRQLAKEIGMSENALTAKMHGRRAFTVTEASRVCNVLNIPANDSVHIFLSCVSQISDIDE